MNSQNDKEAELRKREQEIQEREHAIRLREIEAELYREPSQEPPASPTTKHHPPEGSLNRRLRQAKNIAIFISLVAITAAVVSLASKLAGAVLVIAIAWVGYKLFFEGDRREKK